jgi:hypothetical protein
VFPVQAPVRHGVAGNKAAWEGGCLAAVVVHHGQTTCMQAGGWSSAVKVAAHLWLRLLLCPASQFACSGCASSSVGAVPPGAVQESVEAGGVETLHN